VPKSQQYHMGLGYGTFTGPRLTLGTSLRRTTDSGQHFDAQIKLSPVLSGLATKYFIPGRNPLTDQFTIGANAQTFSPKNGYSYSETLAAGYVKNINLWQDTVSLSFLNERFKVATDSNPNVSSVSRLLYPTFIISRIHTDSVMNPTTGTAFTLTLQGASSHIVSSTSFVQAEIKTKYIFSPKTYGRFIFGMDFGYTIANNFEKLPLTLRYFAGGLGSIRGYPFSSIGPGRYLEILNFEYQHRIMNNISGAIFFDEGTATDHFNNKIFKSHGVGIIYSSFIGPIKFYVAQATSARRRPYRLEFSIGPDF
jgi:translocation and assembly module TamA